jgi:hypothetical protein
MADGRLYLCCACCTEQVLLFKNYEIPGRGYVPSRADIDGFLTAHIGHADCLGDACEYTYPGDPSVIEFAQESPAHYDGSIPRWERRGMEAAPCP